MQGGRNRRGSRKADAFFFHETGKQAGAVLCIQNTVPACCNSRPEKNAQISGEDNFPIKTTGL